MSDATEVDAVRSVPCLVLIRSVFYDDMVIAEQGFSFCLRTVYGATPVYSEWGGYEVLDLEEQPPDARRVLLALLREWRRVVRKNARKPKPVYHALR